ncbi:MAG: PAS domain-containing sensor histidine kinase [Armatimonadota bacterium]
MAVPLCVLLVEDSEDDALLIVESLRKGGFDPQYLRVETEEAFRTAFTGEYWDIIIADYVLPRFSGITAARLVREADSEIPVIVVSGKVGEAAAVEAMRAGAQDYVLKDNLARLVPALQRELRDVAVRRERRKAEEALQHERYLAQRYLDIAGVMMVVLDHDGCITLMNRTGLEILGYRLDEVLGKDWFELVIPARERRQVQEIFHQLMAGSLSPFEYAETVLVNKKGEERLVAFHNSVLRDEAGCITSTLSSGEDITERRKAEEALEAERKRLRTVLESLPVGVFIFDPNGRIVEVNTMAYRIWGGNIPLVESIEGYREYHGRWADTGKPVQPREWASVRALESGETITGDVIDIQRFDHTSGTILVSATPLLDPEGRATGAVSVIQDITARRQVEAALRESEERFRSLFENSHAVMLLIDPESGSIMEANQAAARYYGYPLDALHRLHIWEINMLPREEVLAQMARSRAREQQRFQFRHRLADGQVRDVEVYSGPVNIGSKVLIYSIVHDITERMHAEQERERALAELDATIASIADGLVIYDQDGHIIHINAAARQFFSLHDEEFTESAEKRWRERRIERADGTLLPLSEIPACRALRGEEVRGFIVVVPHPEHTYWLSVSAAPICLPDGAIRGAVSTYTDISPLHDLQEQQQDLIRMVSHDLRAPLTTIKGHQQLLESMLSAHPHDAMEHDSLRAIGRGVQRMTVMIQDLVDIARFEGGQLQLKREPVDLRAFIDDLLKRMSTVMDVNRIRIEFPADLPPVSADYDRLERIFVNLLSNALKYSEPGTPVAMRAKAQDGEVVVSITDQGRGIPPESLPHLFERFYRAPGGRKAEGIGLGLYITRLLVEAHGGCIWAESEPEKGSTFSFTLPMLP